jgi:hypothetical protein
LLSEVIRLGAGGVLIVAAVAKLASPQTSRAALATFGLHAAPAQAIAWGLLIVTELGLGAAVAAGSENAAWLAAALMATFAATMVSAILRGRAGAPCACFGARSTVGWPAVARNALLAAAFAAIPFLPEPDLSTDEWFALGLGVALLAVAGLGVVVLALAREVGILRLRLGPSAALELEGEGPPLNTAVDAIDRFDLAPGARFALGVFTSDGCHVCHGLRPSIESLAGDPLLSVRTFEEAADAQIWRSLDIPGSPYAVALGRDGIVLAKGTFNNLAQLESILATAERRAGAPQEVVGA